MAKHVGTLIMFNRPGGYGFIYCDELKMDIFVHIRSMRFGAPRSLVNQVVVPQEVQFDCKKEQGGKFKAYQVARIGGGFACTLIFGRGLVVNWA